MSSRRTSRLVTRERVGVARRVVSALVVVVSIVAVVLVGRSDVEVRPLSSVAAGAVPVHFRDAKASTWFCPGVPGNDAAISGVLVVSNAGDVPVGGTITRYGSTGGARRQRFAVAARSVLEVDALTGLNAPFVSALVESQGGALVVEQRTTHRAGDAVALCASAPAATWYFADGFTGADSIEHVVITNPSLDSAILDVTFVTVSGERSPQALKGLVVPPESVRVLEMASLDARNELVLAVNVTSTVGRVVVGRSQHYLGRGRLGYTMSLGASAASDRWYFAEGEKQENVREDFIIFNPFRDDQQLTFIITAADGTAIAPQVVTAPGRRVTTFSPTGIPELAVGEFSTVVSASLPDATPAPGVVVERIVTRQEARSTATAVVLGAPRAWTAWVAPSGAVTAPSGAVTAPSGAVTAPSGVVTTPSGAVTAPPVSLRVFNPGSVPATFRIEYLGPAGSVPIVGYEEVVLSPGASTSVQLGVETESTSVSIISDEPVVVQRRTSRGAGRSIAGIAPFVVVATRETR